MMVRSVLANGDSEYEVVARLEQGSRSSLPTKRDVKRLPGASRTGARRVGDI